MFNQGQQLQGTSGLGGMADVRYANSPSAPQAIETIGGLVEFIREQAKQLATNGRVIANSLSGPIPEDCEVNKQPPVNDLHSALREIRSILGDATNATGRARQSLGI